MHRTEKWTKDKPPLLGIMALQYVSSAEALFTILKSFQKGDYLEELKTTISAEEWISFYTQSRHIKNYIIETFKGFGGLASFGAEIFEMLSVIEDGDAKNELNSLTPAEEIKINEFWQHIMQSNLNDIQSDIDGAMDQHLEEKLRSSFKDPEMVFFVRIFLPCWFIYRENHTKLFRKARNGNLDALDKLLRIDKKLIFDNRIKELYIRSENSFNKAVYRTINDALSKRVKPKITLRKVKDRIAGFIAYYSELFGYQLTAPEIQKLFNDLVEDFDKSEFIDDEDLPQTPQSYSKVIQRQKKSIKPSLTPGQK